MKLNSYLLRSTVVASLGGLLFGFDTAVISGTTHALTHTFELSPRALGITVAMAVVGAIFGSMLAGIPGDRYGRRDSLRVLAVLYLVSALGCALAWNWTALVIFRFIGGLGIGGSSVLGPMYIAEVSPAKWRGRLVGLFQFNIVLRNFAGISLELSCRGSRTSAPSNGAGNSGFPPRPRCFSSCSSSPSRAVRAGSSKNRKFPKPARCCASPAKKITNRSCRKSSTSIDAEHGSSDPLFSWKYRLPIFLAVSIGMFNQLSGINAILYYLNDIFAYAGFNAVSSDLQAVAIGATNLIFTMLAMSVIDRIGRRTLLLIGAVGTALCLAGVAAIFLSNLHRDYLVWLLIGYIAFFAFSQGAVIWVYLSEVFPNRVRAKGQSLGSFSHWFMNALISFIFPTLAAASGGYPFVFFAAMMVLQFFVVLFFYPETKGISLEDMQKKLGIA